jgi:hypothetical protein
MADSAILLVDEVLPHQPMRQWVLSVPFPLRFLFATHLTHKTGFTKRLAQTGEYVKKKPHCTMPNKKF